LSTSNTESFEAQDYVAEMKYYYFFEPGKLQHVQAWKKNKNINISNSGGYWAEFHNCKIYPKGFTMRYYMAFSRDAVIKKNTVRKNSVLQNLSKAEPAQEQ